MMQARASLTGITCVRRTARTDNWLRTIPLS
jgi:hypothetical protein